MPSHNRVELIGNLGQDPKIHSFPSGDMQATFSLATSESWTDQRSGEPVTQTQWHNVVVDNQAAAKFARDYLKKGALVAAYGQLKYRDYEKDGMKQKMAEVVVDRFKGELIGLDRKPG